MKKYFWLFLKKNSLTNNLKSIKFKFSTFKPIPQQMSAWQQNICTGIDSLELNEYVKVPKLTRPDSLLVKVKAASINPIDILMSTGYGAKMFSLIKKTEFCQDSQNTDFPLILGRDFSGEVVDVSSFTKSKIFKIGDEVSGIIHPSYQGTFREYISVSSDEVFFKPPSLSHIQAASFPYVASTTWSALSCMGKNQLTNKRILVMGGSGGIGTFAIQLFKAWGAEVTTTASSKNEELLKKLGASFFVDYSFPDAEYKLQQLSGFDFILDAVGGPNLDKKLDLLKPNFRSNYATIVSPLMRSIEENGFLYGGTLAFSKFAQDFLLGLQKGSQVRWSFVKSNVTALSTIYNLIEEKKMQPVIEKIFSFKDLPNALRKVSQKKNCGKTVVSFDET